MIPFLMFLMKNYRQLKQVRMQKNISNVDKVVIVEIDLSDDVGIPREASKVSCKVESAFQSGQRKSK